jgi:hypothetical protein
VLATRPAAASATEKIQKSTRRHDTDVLILLDRHEIRIAGYDQRCAVFDRRSKVLVIVCVFADALELVVASDELSEQNHILYAPGAGRTSRKSCISPRAPCATTCQRP